jgi:hypothetical protein
MRLVSCQVCQLRAFLFLFLRSRVSLDLSASARRRRLRGSGPRLRRPRRGDAQPRLRRQEKCKSAERHFRWVVRLVGPTRKLPTGLKAELFGCAKVRFLPRSRLQRVHLRVRTDGRGQVLHHDGEGGRRGHHPQALQGPLCQGVRGRQSRRQVLRRGSSASSSVSCLLFTYLFPLR